MATKIVKEGHLCRYGSDGRILSFKKSWRECYGVLTDDSILKLYKDQALTSKPVKVNFAASVLWLAYGKDAEKYDPPKVASAEENSQIDAILKSKNYIAIPKDKDRGSITWLASYDKEGLHSWIRAVALTVKEMSKPPILGARRADNKIIMQKLKENFDIDETNAEEWEIYWLYTIIDGNFQNIIDEIYILEIQKSNLIEDDNEGNVVSEPNLLIVPKPPPRSSSTTVHFLEDINEVFSLTKEESYLDEKDVHYATYNQSKIESTLYDGVMDKLSEISTSAPKPSQHSPTTTVSLPKNPNGVCILSKEESYLEEEDVVYVPHKRGEIESIYYDRNMEILSELHVSDATNKMEGDSIDSFIPPSATPIEDKTILSHNACNLTGDQEILGVQYPAKAYDLV